MQDLFRLLTRTSASIAEPGGFDRVRIEAINEEFRLESALLTGVNPDARRSTPPAPAVQSLGGWYPDPYGRFEFRFWDGVAWTKQVANNGAQSIDPLDQN